MANASKQKIPQETFQLNERSHHRLDGVDLVTRHCYAWLWLHDVCVSVSWGIAHSRRINLTLKSMLCNYHKSFAHFGKVM